MCSCEHHPMVNTIINTHTDKDIFFIPLLRSIGVKTKKCKDKQEIAKWISVACACPPLDAIQTVHRRLMEVTKFWKNACGSWFHSFTMAASWSGYVVSDDDATPARHRHVQWVPYPENQQAMAGH